MNACDNPTVLSVILYVKIILKYAFILLPIGAIIMMMIDISKSVIAGKEDEMKKNLNTAIKRVIYLVIIFFVPTIVSFIMSIIDDSLDEDSGYLSCITNATEDGVQAKYQQLAVEKLEEAQANLDYEALDEANTYINKIKDDTVREDAKSQASSIEESINEGIKSTKKISLKTTVERTKNSGSDDSSNATDKSKYYYYNMESPDTKDDYVIKVEPDPNYVSRAVEVTSDEKKWIISTIAHETGGCKAMSVETAQTIRDTYLYFGKLSSNSTTIKSLISSSFSATYISNPTTTEYAEWAFDYVFNKGNSFYPRKFIGQNGFQIKEYASLGYYHILQVKTHYDNMGGQKKYGVDPNYPYGYNWGNSYLDTGGKYADYINPNAKIK